MAKAKTTPHDHLCTKCGAPWSGETGKYPCPKGGQCEIPAARRAAAAPASKRKG